jgi:hypothetical protein
VRSRTRSSPCAAAAVVRLAGQIGEPLIVIEAAVLTPDAAIEYAKAIFASAAEACRRSRLDVAGRC